MASNSPSYSPAPDDQETHPSQFVYLTLLFVDQLPISGLPLNLSGKEQSIENITPLGVTKTYILPELK